MELEFDAGQEELRAAVRGVLAKECPITLVRDVVETGHGGDRLWPLVSALDWSALTVPEANGGMGFGPVEAAILFEECGAAVLPGPLLATAALFVPLVREAADDDQRDRFLRPVADSAGSGTAAVSEFAASSAPGDVEPSVSARPGGDGWTLSGTARFVVEGDAVDEIAVPVSTHDGLGIAVVPAPVVEMQPVRTADRSRRLVHACFDGVSVDGGRMLGEPGDPAVSLALARALDESTAALASELVGTCSTIFDMALAYAGTREQFDVKIGSFQAIKHKLADCYIGLEAARASTYFAAAALAEDDDRRPLGASMAKALAGDAERRLAQEGIQIHGGIGYTWEHDMHLYVKRAMGSAALFGTAEQHRQRVAALLGMAAV